MTEKMTQNPFEVVRLYKSMGVEKRIFLELQSLDQIILQCALASYPLIALAGIIERLLNPEPIPRPYYIFTVLIIILLLFIVRPNLASARFFYLLKYYPPGMLIITGRLLLISHIDWIWYGRIVAVLVNLIAAPAYVKYVKTLRLARKKAIQDILGKQE